LAYAISYLPLVGAVPGVVCSWLATERRGQAVSL
jgi:hypothetical protein